MQLLFTYTTPFQAMFSNEAIPLPIWPWLLARGLVFFRVVETENFHPFIRLALKGHHGSGSWCIARTERDIRGFLDKARVRRYLRARR